MKIPKAIRKANKKVISTVRKKLGEKSIEKDKKLERLEQGLKSRQKNYGKPSLRRKHVQHARKEAKIIKESIKKNM